MNMTTYNKLQNLADLYLDHYYYARTLGIETACELAQYVERMEDDVQDIIKDHRATFLALIQANLDGRINHD